MGSEVAAGGASKRSRKAEQSAIRTDVLLQRTKSHIVIREPSEHPLGAFGAGSSPSSRGTYQVPLPREPE